MVSELVKAGKIPPVLETDIDIKKVIVHNGRFHADDVGVIALLRECYNPDIEYERVDYCTLNSVFVDILEKEPNTIIADVGGSFDGERRFDHHQMNSGESHCALSLLWGVYGNPYYSFLGSFIKEIAEHDSKRDLFKRTQTLNCIGYMNAYDANSEENMRNLEKAIDIMRTLIRGCINEQIIFAQGVNKIEESYKYANDSKTIAMIPSDLIYCADRWASLHPEVRAVAYHKANKFFVTMYQWYNTRSDIPSNGIVTIDPYRYNKTRIYRYNTPNLSTVKLLVEKAKRINN